MLVHALSLARAHHRRAATWGLDILTGTAPGSGEQVRQVFDRAWTVDHATAELQESYQWRIDGVDFELAVEGGRLIRTPGRCAAQRSPSSQRTQL